VGTVTNITATEYTAPIEIELGLYAADGAKVGTTTQSIAGIGPREVWRYSAPISDPEVVSVKVQRVGVQKKPAVRVVR
jgi:hypothetical protein